MDQKSIMLIVDENNRSRDIIKDIFKDIYSISEADSAEAAFDILKRKYKSIAVIIQAMNLPDIDVCDMLKKMTDNSLYSDIPVIIVTSANEEEKEKAVFESGASDMVQEPFTPEFITHKVENVIHEKEIMKIKKENSIEERNDRFREVENEFMMKPTKISALINTLPGGFGVFSVEEDTIKNIYSNESLSAMFGVSGNAYTRYIRDDVLRVIHPDDIKEIRTVIETIKKSRETADVCIRIKMLNGCWVWMMARGQFLVSEPDKDLLYVMFVDISKEKQYEEVINYRSTHDIVTGIYNKHAFLENTHIMMSENPDKAYVLIVFNVERFKVIHYLLGTEYTDELLKRIAKILREQFGKYGTYGRLETDSFAICYEQTYFNIDDINQTLTSKFIDYRLGYRIVCNFGIYVSKKYDVSVSKMCDRANLAMQSIKGNYNKNYVFYDEQFKQKIVNEQEITSEMQKALDNEQFVIYMQPVYSVSKNIPVSAEALVRWIHPCKGIIPPVEFISLFEANGFIAKLDRYVWEAACKYQRKQLDKGNHWVPISVNISRMSFYNERLADEIYAILKKYDLTPQHIKIELTESAYTDNPTQLIEAVDKLRSYGFLILMDDFGSGYSSLNMLKDITVDILKIDMRFMSDFEKSIKAGKIITSVVQMANSLALDVVAEGAETKSQIDFLTSIGCDNIQGYYFSKPIPCDKFERPKNAKVIDVEYKDNSLEPLCELSANGDSRTNDESFEECPTIEV